MKVIWSAASVRHLHEAYEYVDAKNAAAGTIRRRIPDTAKRLGALPFAGCVGRIEGTREAVVPRTPYIVVYQVFGQTVEILGIWHGSRSWLESL